MTRQFFIMVLKPKRMLLLFQILILTGLFVCHKDEHVFPISPTWWFPVGISFLTKHLYCCLSPPELGISLLTETILIETSANLRYVSTAQLFLCLVCVFFFFFKSRHGKWSTHVRESSPLDRMSAFSHCWPPPVKHCLLPKINPHRLPFSEWPRTPTRVFPQLGENEVAKPEAKFFSWEVLSTLWKMLPLV